MCNKIINRFYIQIAALTIFLTLLLSDTDAQDLNVIRKYSEYRRSVKKDSLKKMVELKTIMPDIDYDLRYATSNNFLHEQLYKNGEITVLRLVVARSLARVQQELTSMGLSLKIWDAYRPYSITVRMWDLIKDDRYVANPKRGSGHNRGIAIDLTIINKTDGAELNMGTGFDNFSDTAHADFMKLPADILRNRKLLRTTMEKYGFNALETEWWHFYWNNSEFEILDIDPGKLKL
jgi:D-alanyl-D-alanine dipeptidase